MRFQRFLAGLALVGLSWFGYSGHAEYRAQQPGIYSTTTSTAATAVVRRTEAPLISRDLFRSPLAASAAPVEPTSSPTNTAPYEVTPNPVYQYYKPADFPVSTATSTGSPNPAAGGDFRGFAFSLVPASQRVCLDKLWTHESRWQVTSRNHDSGAYGIPQALPASKMAVAGADYLTNGETQIRWGLRYIKDRYGDACNAWAHEKRYGSY